MVLNNIISLSFNIIIIFSLANGSDINKESKILKTRDLYKGSQIIQVGQREPYTAAITRITLPKRHCIDSLRLKTPTILTGAEDIEIVFEECQGRWKLIHYSNLKNQFDFQMQIKAQTLAILSAKPIEDIKEAFIGICDDDSTVEDNITTEECQESIKQAKSSKRHKRETSILKMSPSRIKVSNNKVAS